jgi:hypothetical protein
MPTRHEPIVPSVVVRQKRPAPAIRPRPWIGRRPVCGHTCSHSSERAVPQPQRAASREEEPLAGCCCDLLRPKAPPRALGSQLYLEALGCSQRVLGLLLHLFNRAAGPHARPSSEGPALIAYAEQSPAHATVKQSSPRSRRSLVQRRRTAAASGERTNANLGKRICSRQTDDARTKLAAGSERRMESACADHLKCVGSKATAGGKCWPGCMETFHLRRE